MQTRRHFIGNVATGGPLAGSFATGRAFGANERIRVGSHWRGRSRHAAWRAKRRRVPASRSPLLPISMRDGWKTRANCAWREGILAITASCWPMAPLTRCSSRRRSICMRMHSSPALMPASTCIWKSHGVHAGSGEADADGFLDAPERAVQIGHQACSIGAGGRCRELSRERRCGAGDGDSCAHVPQYAAWQAAMDRPRVSGYDARSVWRGKQFLGGAPERDFDADRYVNWRLFCDYSGGNVHENHVAAARVLVQGDGAADPLRGDYDWRDLRWRDGREVPDTMNVSMALTGRTRKFSSPGIRALAATIPA